MWEQEYRQHDKACPKESFADVYQPVDAEECQTAKEWEEQPGECTEYVGSRKLPTSSHDTMTLWIAGKE